MFQKNKNECRSPSVGLRVTAVSVFFFFRAAFNRCLPAALFPMAAIVLFTLQQFFFFFFGHCSVKSCLCVLAQCSGERCVTVVVKVCVHHFQAAELPEFIEAEDDFFLSCTLITQITKCTFSLIEAGKVGFV